MYEHLFDPATLDEHTATERACEVAERLLDEVSRARHSWTLIERLARILVLLSSTMARREVGT